MFWSGQLDDLFPTMDVSQDINKIMNGDSNLGEFEDSGDVSWVEDKKLWKCVNKNFLFVMSAC